MRLGWKKTLPSVMQKKRELVLTVDVFLLTFASRKKLIAALIKPYKEYLISHDIIFTEGVASSKISRAKARGQSAKKFFQEIEQTEHQKKLHAAWRASESSNPEIESKSLDRIVAEIYIGYDQVLKDNNALDFDDLLVYGVKLFKEHYEMALWCRHILVDEL